MNGVDIGITSNVSIRVVNGDNGEYKEIQGHNLATKQMLLGIWSFLRGMFVLPDNSTLQAAKDVSKSVQSYCPYFLRVGAGTSDVSFDDYKLDDPLYVDGTIDDLPYPYTQGTDVYEKHYDSADYLEEFSDSITLQLKFYIPSDVLPGTAVKTVSITEWALYSKGDSEDSHNGFLLARFVPKDENHDPIVIEKGENDFIDVLWEITLHSISEDDLLEE